MAIQRLLIDTKEKIALGHWSNGEERITVEFKIEDLNPELHISGYHEEAYEEAFEVANIATREQLLGEELQHHDPLLF